jgi:hypothetical protein
MKLWLGNCSELLSDASELSEAVAMFITKHTGSDREPADEVASELSASMSRSFLFFFRLWCPAVVI